MNAKTVQDKQFFRVCAAGGGRSAARNREHEEDDGEEERGGGGRKGEEEFGGQWKGSPICSGVGWPALLRDLDSSLMDTKGFRFHT